MRKKLFEIAIYAIALVLGTSCAKEPAPDYDGGYGYVQFKLYKEVSYNATKATQLDYLHDACKVNVSMYHGEDVISQTLVLSSSDKESAEFGLRSSKLKLLPGDYSIITFTLFDALDNELYRAVPEVADFKVVSGGMTVKDLTVNVLPRGKVQFSFVKDLSGFVGTKAVSRQYTFDEIAFVDITVTNTQTNERESFEKLKTKFMVHFDDDETTFGYLTSSLSTADSLSLKAGRYKVTTYSTFSSDKILLETNYSPAEYYFTVTDNAVSKPEVPVTLYESDEYIKDYYAVYEIWKALDGPNWYFRGQGHPIGSNWDFNKDPDLWGDQPGVEVYSNGRVAKLNLEGYDFKGYLPAAIGQLTEMDQLYLGNHNDYSFIPEQPGSASKAALFERHKKLMSSLHPATPMSEPIARALKEHNIDIPEIRGYEEHSERELIDLATGRSYNRIKLMDNAHGVYSNGLTGIDPAIGKLTKLEYLYIANCPLKSLPEEMKNMESVTDLELYNCPDMKEFPMAITQMPNLISVNISNNSQWSSSEILKGLKGFANGPSAEKIQIMYISNNNLEELPAEISKFKAMGLFDATYNKIRKTAPFGRDINLVNFYIDHNELEDFGRDEMGYFCGIEDVETFSVTFNKFRKFPDIFSAQSLFAMTTVDFSFNMIDGVEHAEEGTYRGIQVATLTIANNPLKEFPTCFAKSESGVSYFNLRGCEIETVSEEAFKSENAMKTTSFDLSYNHISDLPEKTFNAVYLPYVYGIDLSSNRFSEFPWETLDSAYLTVLGLRQQRDANGRRCLREWPTGIYQHKGLRGLYLGSNDLRKVYDTISPLIYYVDISDNPNITFDASDICSVWMAGSYILIYDKSQNIVNCDYMLL